MSGLKTRRPRLQTTGVQLINGTCLKIPMTLSTVQKFDCNENE